MKKTNLILAVVALLAFSIQAVAGDEYKVNTKSSKLEWLAKKVTGQHNGEVAIKSGSLDFKGNKLNGGEFVIDMTTIKVLDIENPTYNKKLTDHLNSDDFFNTQNYKEAKLKITGVKKSNSDKGNYEITADLTIKGKTNPITFPAQVSKDGSKVTATATIVFDRSKYDVRYGSNSFFDNLGDKAIYDDVEMTVSLVTE